MDLHLLDFKKGTQMKDECNECHFRQNTHTPTCSKYPNLVSKEEYADFLNFINNFENHEKQRKQMSNTKKAPVTEKEIVKRLTELDDKAKRQLDITEAWTAWKKLKGLYKQHTLSVTRLLIK